MLQTSPYMGKQVEVTALVLVPPHVITFTSHGKAFVICDTGAAMNEPWSHVFVRYAGTEEQFDADGYNSLEAGDIISIKGTISEFPTNQMNSLTQFAPTIGEPVVIISSGNALPQIPHLQVADFKVGAAQGGKVNIFTGERYESQKVMLTDLTVTFILNSFRGTFTMTDANGNSISTYDWSYHFTLDTISVDRVGNPKDLNYKLPAIGTKVDTIIGYISTSSGGESVQGYRICPMYPEDVKYGGILPQVTTHRRYPIIVAKDSTPLVTAKVYKQPSSYDITGAKLVYRVNNGSWNEIAMTAKQPETDSLYSATIPAQNVGDYVYYFIKAIDANEQTGILANSGGTTFTDTAKGLFFYKVLDRSVKPVLSIRDVQYTPFTNGRSPYVGAVDSIGGIITADTSSLVIAPTNGSIGTSAWYMQSTNQPWSGIWMGGPDTIMTKLHLGDSVVVVGTVTEFNDVTEIFPVTAARIVSQNNPLPQPVVLKTEVFGSGIANGDPGAEPYEGMLVQFRDVTVSNINPTFVDTMEYEVSNSSKAVIVRHDGRNTYSNIPNDTLFGYTILRQGNTIGSLTGIIYYNNNRYKIVPRTNADFENVTSVRLRYNDRVPKQYFLQQNFPNPFNPTTTIQYALPVGGLAQLKVYNILGQEVATLVHEVQSAGTYQATFDASRLASGMYFYKLTSGDFSQVKKMLLVK
jgi:hypothetical protein